MVSKRTAACLGCAVLVQIAGIVFMGWVVPPVVAHITLGPELPMPTTNSATSLARN